MVASGTSQGSKAATRTAAQFTASEFNGAMFHVVTRDLANGSFETQKISVLHNFNDAFMSSSAVTSMLVTAEDDIKASLKLCNTEIFCVSKLPLARSRVTT